MTTGIYHRKETYIRFILWLTERMRCDNQCDKTVRYHWMFKWIPADSKYENHRWLTGKSDKIPVQKSFWKYESHGTHIFKALLIFKLHENKLYSNLAIQPPLSTVDRPTHQTEWLNIVGSNQPQTELENEKVITLYHYHSSGAIQITFKRWPCYTTHHECPPRSQWLKSKQAKFIVRNRDPLFGKEIMWLERLNSTQKTGLK